MISIYGHRTLAVTRNLRRERIRLIPLKSDKRIRDSPATPVMSVNNQFPRPVLPLSFQLDARDSRQGTATESGSIGSLRDRAQSREHPGVLVPAWPLGAGAQAVQAQRPAHDIQGLRLELCAGEHRVLHHGHSSAVSTMWWAGK